MARFRHRSNSSAKVRVLIMVGDRRIASVGRLQVSLRRSITRNALLFLLYSAATFGATAVYDDFAAFAAAQSEPGLTLFGCNVSTFS
jgi:hypothetical protein